MSAAVCAHAGVRGPPKSPDLPMKPQSGFAGAVCGTGVPPVDVGGTPTPPFPLPPWGEGLRRPLYSGGGNGSQFFAVALHHIQVVGREDDTLPGAFPFFRFPAFTGPISSAHAIRRMH